MGCAKQKPQPIEVVEQLNKLINLECCVFKHLYTKHKQLQEFIESSQIGIIPTTHTICFKAGQHLREYISKSKEAREIQNQQLRRIIKYQQQKNVGLRGLSENGEKNNLNTGKILNQLEPETIPQAISRETEQIYEEKIEQENTQNDTQQEIRNKCRQQEEIWMEEGKVEIWKILIKVRRKKMKRVLLNQRVKEKNKYNLKMVEVRKEGKQNQIKYKRPELSRLSWRFQQRQAGFHLDKKNCNYVENCSQIRIMAKQQTHQFMPYDRRFDYMIEHEKLL